MKKGNEFKPQRVILAILLVVVLVVGMAPATLAADASPADDPACTCEAPCAEGVPDPACALCAGGEACQAQEPATSDDTDTDEDALGDDPATDPELPPEAPPAGDAPAAEAEGEIGILAEPSTGGVSAWAGLDAAIKYNIAIGKDTIALNISKDFFTTPDIGALTVPAGKHLILRSPSNSDIKTITRGVGHTTTFFTLLTDSTLTLENITLDGNGQAVPSTKALVSSSSGSDSVGGTLNLNNGATLQNNTNTTDGTGVGIDYAGAVFNCNLNMAPGSVIQGNIARGGAVYLVRKTFNMSGGAIRNNRLFDGALSAIGGVAMVGGTFNMSGGSIIGNIGGETGGLNLSSNYDTTFNMSGGRIAGNKALGNGTKADGIFTYQFSSTKININISGSAQIGGPSGGNGIYYNDKVAPLAIGDTLSPDAFVNIEGKYGGLAAGDTVATGAVQGHESQFLCPSYTVNYDTNNAGRLILAEEETEPATQVLGMAPLTGPQAGGTIVTFTGKGLANVTGAMFGNVPAGVISASDTKVTVRAPRHAAGEVDVSLLLAHGSLVAPYPYVYATGATVLGITPRRGPMEGGTRIHITGQKLKTVTEVTIGGVKAPIVTKADDHLTVEAPAAEDITGLPADGMATMVLKAKSTVLHTSSYVYYAVPQFEPILQTSERLDAAGGAITVRVPAGIEGLSGDIEAYLYEGLAWEDSESGSYDSASGNTLFLNAPQNPGPGAKVYRVYVVMVGEDPFEARHAPITVTVDPPEARKTSISLSTSHITMGKTVSDTTSLSIAFDGGVKPSVRIFDFETGDWADTNSALICLVEDLASGRYPVELRPANTDRNLLLRFSDPSDPTVYADCQVDIVAPLASYSPDVSDYPTHIIDGAPVTLYTRSSSPAMAKLHVGNAEGKTDLRLASDPKIGIEFVKVAYNTALKLKATSSGDIEVSKQPTFTGTLAKKYAGPVQIVITDTSLPDDKLVLPVKGTLTVNVSDGPPKLAAAAIAVNSFYDSAYSMNPVIRITGGSVSQVRLSQLTDQKKRNDNLRKAGWFTPAVNDRYEFITPLAPYLTMTPGITANRNGTLYLQVKLEGWSDEWVPVAVKVSRSHTAPAVKLSATKVTIYTGDDNQGAPVNLAPKSKKNTLAGLGVIGLATAPREKKYTFNASAADATAGVLKPKRNERPVKGEKIYLEATVAGTNNTVPLTVTVGSVATPKTKVTLKPSRSIVTLNPLPVNGESVLVTLVPSISGYNLAGKLNAKNITVTPLKGAPEANKPEVRLIDDKTIEIAVSDSTPKGKSYRVQVAVPGAYRAANNEPRTAVATITVKTAKADPSVSLKATGKVNLGSTQGGLTVNATFANYNGTFLDSKPAFKITYPDATTYFYNWSDLASNPFDIQLDPDVSNRWSIHWRTGHQLAAGTYKLGISNCVLADGLNSAGTDSDITFKVVAVPGKIAPTPSKVTLYRNNRYSTASTVLKLPVDLPAGTTVVPEAGTAANRFTTSYNDATRRLDVRFNTTGDWQNAGSTKLKLQVFLPNDITVDSKGNPKPAATFTLQVNVVK